MPILQWGAIGLLVLIYGGSGVVELPMWRKSVDQYVQWGYPRWWAIVTPALKVLAAALVIFSQTRLIGAALCALIGMAAAATVLRFRARNMYAAALPVALLTLISAGILFYLDAIGAVV